MRTATQIVDPVEDRWPPDAPRPGDALGQLLLASHLLGADRAVSNFGGGNTSAKGRAVDHIGREVDVMWVKGSGSRPGHDGPAALHRRCSWTRCCRCSSATR